jgi:hypothetical protein
VEVTEDARRSGRPIDKDWTEVVLFGHKAEQDTVDSPYGGDPDMPRGWIARDLYMRFASLPAEVDFILRDGCNTLGGDQRFVPFMKRLDRFTKHEAVAADQGIRIHYVYDAADAAAPGGLKSARDALQPAQSSAALIYRDEIYDLLPYWAWVHVAPVFGIPFGAKYISIFVELPNDFPLLPDGYRQFLRYNRDLQRNVQVRDFAGAALRHRPAWLLDLLRSFAPDASHVDHLHGAMASLFRYLGVRRRWWPAGNGGKRPPGGEGIEYEVAPQIVPLRDETDIRERGMDKKAARFYAETHQIFVNTAYAAFKDFAGLLEAEFGSVEDQEQVRRAALEVSERFLTHRICRKLVYALSKRETWQGWEVDQATSMYSLTLAADDHTELLAEAREEMRNRFGDTAYVDPRLSQARDRLAVAMEDPLSLRSRRAGSSAMEITFRVN